MEENENTTPEDSPTGQPASPGESAGQMVRTARERAGIPVDKLCTDLRIAPSTLEAVETGDYNSLAGPPYVRAMLVSLSRYLRLDQKEILEAYARESGNKPEAPIISPYKDDSPTHARAHKQIFILLLAVLLFILLLIMGKVTTTSESLGPSSPPVAGEDTLLSLEPLNETGSGPGEPAAADTGADAGADTLDAAEGGEGEAGEEAQEEVEEEETNRDTRVRLLGIVDSIWIRILPAGRREVSDYLSATRPMEFTHSDAITFITRQGRTVRVLLDDTTIVPSRRRFVVDGNKVTY